MALVPFWFAKLCSNSTSFNKSDTEERQRYHQPPAMEMCLRWVDWRKRGFQTPKETKQDEKE